MRASIIQQKYLAEAYRIAHYQGDNPYITTSALAERMNVSAPAVAAVVERLKRGGFVEHEPYRGMRLTPKGEREALMSIRRHRIVEVFLVKVMGFAWHEVHDEADAIGAVIGEELTARMEKMAGYPKRCPHGEPIPTADGVMPPIHDVQLSAIEDVPKELIVSRVSSHDPEVLKYLGSLQLVPEQRIALLNRAPFHGPLRLRIGKQEQVIGYELARSIRVTPA
ncbi:MAG: metal-dependent transcriptional regulator [Chloroflexi bacterium]|nr:metal-dependent transcriptional regulator [Chloroflexota bacterium]